MIDHTTLAVERLRLMAVAPPVPAWFEPLMPKDPPGANSAWRADWDRLWNVNRMAQWPAVWADMMITSAATTRVGELMDLCGVAPTFYRKDETP